MRWGERGREGEKKRELNCTTKSISTLHLSLSLSLSLSPFLTMSGYLLPFILSLHRLRCFVWTFQECRERVKRKTSSSMREREREREREWKHHSWKENYKQKKDFHSRFTFFSASFQSFWSQLPLFFFSFFKKNRQNEHTHNEHYRYFFLSGAASLTLFLSLKRQVKVIVFLERFFFN